MNRRTRSSTPSTAAMHRDECRRSGKPGQLAAWVRLSNPLNSGSKLPGLSHRRTTLANPARRRGLTLVEVAAGLALMAGLLVAMLAIKSRAARQLSDADRHLRGVAAADGLLSRWWADPSTLPVDASGTVPADPALTWQTRMSDAEPALARAGLRVVRLVVSDPRTPAGTSPVLASVEVTLPPAVKEPPAAAARGGR